MVERPERQHAERRAAADQHAGDGPDAAVAAADDDRVELLLPCRGQRRRGRRRERRALGEHDLEADPLMGPEGVEELRALTLDAAIALHRAARRIDQDPQPHRSFRHPAGPAPRSDF